MPLPPSFEARLVRARILAPTVRELAGKKAKVVLLSHFGRPKGRDPKAPWKSQTDLLTIADEDYISDSGEEIWSILEARGIKHVVLMGVHLNMCVLGRPFGLRQMAKNGKDVALMRDMTDTMYNPKRAPYVSHFAGTDLMIEHVEKFVAPSITERIRPGTSAAMNN